jgi:hypothetical protein
LRYAAKHFREIEYIVGGAGKNGNGKHRLDVWALSHGMNPEIWVVKEHPILKRLPTALAIFAFEFLQHTLVGLPVPAGQPSVQQANCVLQTYLCFGQDGRHLRTFSCLTLQLKGLEGVQHVRSYPFGTHTFFGKNNRPTVFVVQPPQYSEFSWANIDITSAEDATYKLWVGCVELLFGCSF